MSDPLSSGTDRQRTTETQSDCSHTPGPWEIDQEWLPPEHPKWRSINLGESYVSVSGHIGEANARLIAAAPDLLAALREIATECPYKQWADIARNAIAKTEGRS